MLHYIFSRFRLTLIGGEAGAHITSSWLLSQTEGGLLLFHAEGLRHWQAAAAEHSMLVSDDCNTGKLWLVVVVVCRWVHTKLVVPFGLWLIDVLLPTTEEALKVLINGLFVIFRELLNKLAAGILMLSTLGQKYNQQRVSEPEQAAAWRRWHANATGTFNMLVEQELLGAASPTQAAVLAKRKVAAETKGIGMPSVTEEGGEEAGTTAPGMAVSSPQQRPRNFERLDSTEVRRERVKKFFQLRDTRRMRSPDALPAADAGGGRPRLARANTRIGMSFVLRSGDALFGLPPGFAVQQGMKSRGLLEDFSIVLEVGLDKLFTALRRGLRVALRLPPSHLANSARGGGTPVAERLRNMTRRSMRLAPAAQHFEGLDVWTTSDVILRAGYPCEEHTVTTDDGYILQLHRIPRPGARDVAFFQHGMFDTSMGWVANGSTGSSAFGAYDAGFDVWLGNSRANAPRLHKDKSKRGSRFWCFNVNQLGIGDIGAHVAHIHKVKMAELQSGRRIRTGNTVRGLNMHAPGSAGSSSSSTPAAAPGRAPTPQRAGGGTATAASTEREPRAALYRSASDTALSDMRFVDIAAAAALEAEQSRKAGRGSKSTASAGPGAAVPAGACTLRRVASAPEPLQSLPGLLHPSAADRVVPSADFLLQRTNGGASAAKPLGTVNGRLGGLQLKGAKVPEASGLRSAAAEVGPSSSVDKGMSLRAVMTATVAAGKWRKRVFGEKAASESEALPYRLQAVGHSLGAASLLVYATYARMRGECHKFQRIILMSPAGFHTKLPLVVSWLKSWLPYMVYALDRVLPGFGMGVVLPSSMLRYIFFRFAHDIRSMPALNDLMRAFIRVGMSGDDSEWAHALVMPHYNTTSMPGLSLHVCAHIAQWTHKKTGGKFNLFDFGSTSANMRHYGTPKPPSLADNFHLLDVPVDLVSGEADHVIPPCDVEIHYKHMKEAGVNVTYRVMKYGHMDFTLAVRDEIREFVLSRLLAPL